MQNQLSRKRAKKTSFLEVLENRCLLSASQTLFEPLLTFSPQVTNPTVVGLSPAKIKTAYNLTGLAYNGSGQTIAIIDAYNDPNIKADLTKFDTQFGLPPATLNVMSQTGSKTLPAKNASWDLEIALDVEWAHAIAPGATIDLIEAKTASSTNLLAAVNHARTISGVSVVSMSWVSTEFAGETGYNSDFTTPSGHKGITFVAASGDDGSKNGPLWPSISSNVLAVGGTTLKLTSTGAYLSETGWSGSTGGVSIYQSKAAYQDGVQSYSKQTSPDVSFDGSPTTGLAVYDSIADNAKSGWFQVGGTSAGTPSWAGIIAIADQDRAASTLNTLNGATGTLPALYSVASNPGLYSADFHDVTTGSNGTTKYKAHKGYDLVTGLGSPNGANIINLLFSASNAAATASPADGTAATPISVTPATTLNMALVRHMDPNGSALADSAVAGSVEIGQEDLSGIAVNQGGENLESNLLGVISVSTATPANSGGVSLAGEAASVGGSPIFASGPMIAESALPARDGSHPSMSAVAAVEGPMDILVACHIDMKTRVLADVAPIFRVGHDDIGVSLAMLLGAGVLMGVYRARLRGRRESAIPVLD